jgi:hypothetical protein
MAKSGGTHRRRALTGVSVLDAAALPGSVRFSGLSEMVSTISIWNALIVLRRPLLLTGSDQPCKKWIGAGMANSKERAHELIDRLPARQLPAVVGVLEAMLDPLSLSLVSAPVEEEEITTETAASLDRARASLARGEGIPHEEIRREFGLDK